MLRECLDSIALSKRQSFDLRRVVVVDNGSHDDSLAAALTAPQKEELRLPLLVIRNEQNLGFGRACNQGAAKSDADYLLFLNPDAKLFANSLEVPMAVMESADGQRLGVCGIGLIGDDGKVARSCARFPTFASMACAALGIDRFGAGIFPSAVMNEWAHDVSRDVDHVIGAFYFIRRELFRSLGGFDEQFFVYLEDLDLSARIREAGFGCRYLTAASAYHRGGGVSAQARARRLAYSLESRLRYSVKHFTIAAAIAIGVLTFVIEPWLRLIHALVILSHARMTETVGGYALLSASILRGLSRAARAGHWTRQGGDL